MICVVLNLDYVLTLQYSNLHITDNVLFNVILPFISYQSVRELSLIYIEYAVNYVSDSQ